MVNVYYTQYYGSKNKEGRSVIDSAIQKLIDENPEYGEFIFKNT